ncbi:MAG: DNA primase, partial [Candidatus Altiarchaeota archaeon]|nr:DNA primase [Candidatus Altiarchaeota archaeon]
MGKISPVAAKYIIKAELKASGVIEKPDAIGAIFGQTEGLLGAELELRELQKSGRIGRIEVHLDIKNGKTKGMIEIPSSMDKSETAVIASAMETIDRIGPCEAEIKIVAVEDVREMKRKFIVDRAKNILKDMVMKSPDTQEMVEEVAVTVRAAELIKYGPERLAAGPAIDISDDLIIVEGRADVLNLLKNGFKSVISMEGTKIPKTVIELTKSKTTTLFVDGDRGGDLIIKELLMLADLDFVAKAPDGKEVEELTKKEIHKALRSGEAADQYKTGKSVKSNKPEKQETRTTRTMKTTRTARTTRRTRETITKPTRKPRLTKDKKEQFKNLLDDLVGSKGAYILRGTEILGKVPITELVRYLEILKADTVVMDGVLDNKLVHTINRYGIDIIICSRIEPDVNSSNVLTTKD